MADIYSRAPATGYPYPPHPAQPLRNPNPNPNPRATLLRRLLATLIFSSIILATAVFIIWLVLRPRLPSFHVTSLSLSNFTTTSPSSVTGNWDVRLTSLNPNTKIHLHYSHIDAALFYEDAQLARTAVPPFDQGRKNLTALRAAFSVADAYVERWAVDGINRERIKGRVEFNLRLLAVVRFKPGFWRERRRWVRVYCGDLGVGLGGESGNGSFVGGGERRCRVWF